MAGRTYRVRIVRGDQQFEAEGDKAFVMDMLKRFDGGSSSSIVWKTASKSTASASPTALASSKALSVGEFMRQFGFKKHTDRVLALAYYLEHHSGQQEFTPADINNLYYEAKMEPSNTSQAIIYNIKRRYLMIAKSDKSKSKKGAANKYPVTSTGENYIKKLAAQTAEAE